jgi:hypothetical protein
MFDFVSSPLAPGATWTDDHHYGVQVWNTGTTPGTVAIRGAGLEIVLRLAPDHGITVNDETSQVITVENTGTDYLSVEWKKTRD